MVKLLHFADAHLGMVNFGSTEFPAGLHSRVLDFLDSLDILCEVAASEQPDLILFAGDAFRTRTPNPTLVTQFSSRIQTLANIAPVVMVVGNHDKQRTGDEKQHSITIMRELKADHEIYVCDDVCAIDVAGAYIVTLPWFYDRPIDEICTDLDTALGFAPDDVPCILLGHCTVVTAKPSDNYEFETRLGPDNIVYPLEMFCDDVWDYVALGHIHKHQCLCDSPPVVYAGSIDRCDWGERNDAKGFILADVVAGDATWNFVDLHTRQMIQIEITIDRISNIADMDVEDAIVRVLVSSNKSVTQASVLRKVADVIGDCYILDAVSIVVDKTVREQRYESRHYEAMSMVDVMGAYFDQKYSNDSDRADLLYNAVIDLMESVED